MVNVVPMGGLLPLVGGRDSMSCYADPVRQGSAATNTSAPRLHESSPCPYREGEESYPVRTDPSAPNLLNAHLRVRRAVVASQAVPAEPDHSFRLRDVAEHVRMGGPSPRTREDILDAGRAPRHLHKEHGNDEAWRRVLFDFVCGWIASPASCLVGCAATRQPGIARREAKLSESDHARSLSRSCRSGAEQQSASPGGARSP
jgi:hypothetical protein